MADREPSAMLDVESVESSPPNSIDECIARLQAGWVVVTETQRLKHLIEDGYNRAMLARGKRSWPSAEVYVWNVWLRQLWLDLDDRSEHDTAQLLSTPQSMQVWERAIAQDVQEEYSEQFEYLLWHITATAGRARSAYGLMQGYQIDPADFAGPLSRDVEHFLRWLTSYQQRLESQNWIDLESLPTMLSGCAKAIFDMNPAGIVFAEFDQWTPQQQQLLKVLGEFGEAERLTQTTTGSPDQHLQLEFERVDDEISACAHWARAVIEADSKNHRVGIVAPRLDRLYGRIMQKFSGVLNPDQVMGKRELQHLSFHVTLGNALGETPLIVDALNLIELIRPEIELSVLCSVIQSDRIRGWEEEYSARAALRQAMVSLGPGQLSLADVEKVILRRNLRCDQLLKILRNAGEMIAKLPQYADYTYWGNFFMDWMKNFQSEKRENRQFGATEKQAHESWSELVGALAELGYVSSPVRVDTAIGKLRRMITEVSVQPRAIDVPVQVGEMVTMAGQSFTHLWMLGMNNEVLPGSPRPNPFIPISVQKDKGIPDSSASLVEQSVSQRMERTLGSAVHVVLSYAVTDGSSYHQPSGLLRNLKKAEPDLLAGIAPYPDYWQSICEDRHLCRRFTDWHAGPVEDTETIRGGTSILKNQSRCPFSAFATHRLHARQPEQSDLGISALDRGSLVHGMFERLYQKVRSLEEFSDASGQQVYLDAAREQAEQVVTEYVDNQIKPISGLLAETEIERMVDLARQWLAEELKREPFAVWDTERELSIEFAGLPVRLKIDRIDEIPGSRLIVIDYKTGNCYMNDTVGPRIKEPQLLMYACALAGQGEHVVDIAFARVKRGDMGFLSRASLKENSGILVKEWQITLNTIAREFLEGTARVDPIDRYICDYCHLSPLCRKDDRSDHLLETEPTHQ